MTNGYQRLAYHLPSPTKTLLLSGQCAEEKRKELLNYFTQTWELYESLFECLQDERAYYTKAIPLRHPLIFYFGHTATFYINKLIASHLLHQRINPQIESMMAIGVDEMSWDDVDSTHYQWPTIVTLRNYRAQVKALISELISTMPLTLPIDWHSPAWIILMGIEHERIHLETSSVLIRQLPIAWVRSQPYWPVCPQYCSQPSFAPKNSLIAVQGHSITLGKKDDTYGWDNEYGQHSFEVKNFKASQMLVSNAEYLAFVQDQGYHNAQWWDDEGWRWREYTQAELPTFWLGSATEPEMLKLRLMTEEILMPWDWPVEVNQLEASAFCRWKTQQCGEHIQLPSESEWYLLREQVAGDQYTWETPPGNINLAYWASPAPVNLFKHGQFYDVIGNVWQWTQTPFYSFPGFQVHPLYDDFSTPTFDGKHTLIKGGSFISTGNEALRSARYAFRRHFFQHAGFRYVASASQETIMTNPYETDTLVSQYLDFQYGPCHFAVPNYAKALVNIALEHCKQHHRALDIGCATGRASFELAAAFNQVIAIDYSARFIEVAERLRNGEMLRYVTTKEGELVEYHQISLKDIGINPVQCQKVQFIQGDACNLKPQPDYYDLVFASNLIDRLYQPKQFLSQISTMIRTGGLLLLSSPYTWLSEFTPKENWLGGIRENGEALTSYHALQHLLQADFEEITPARDLAFVIRETARKYQHSVAQVTLWKKR